MNWMIGEMTDKTPMQRLREQHERERNDPEQDGPLAPVMRTVEVGVVATQRLINGMLETADDLLDAMFGDDDG